MSDVKCSRCGGDVEHVREEFESQLCETCNAELDAAIEDGRIVDASTPVDQSKFTQEDHDWSMRHDRRSKH
jgi:predicted amidophosphoribosyltransferase